MGRTQRFHLNLFDIMDPWCWLGVLNKVERAIPFVWVSVTCSWCWVFWACVFGAILKYMMDICGFFAYFYIAFLM